MSGTSEFWNCPRMWDGSIVAIIGGGPSLKNMDWAKFRKQSMALGVRTIACNDSYALAWPDMLFFGDAGWYKIHSPAVKYFQGLKVTCESGFINDPDLLVLERRLYDPHRPERGVIPEQNRICWYGNTGVTAIQLAAKLGALEILLLGFDMKLGIGGVSNWYKNLKDKPKKLAYRRFIQSMNSCKKALALGWPEVKVCNCNLDSASDAFQKMEWQEVLAIS